MASPRPRAASIPRQRRASTRVRSDAPSGSGRAERRPCCPTWNLHSPAAAFAFPTVVVATERAAVSLVDVLVVRSPSYARPTRLGLVPDGAGVGFSPTTRGRPTDADHPFRPLAAARLTPFRSKGSGSRRPSRASLLVRWIVDHQIGVCATRTRVPPADLARKRRRLGFPRVDARAHVRPARPHHPPFRVRRRFRAPSERTGRGRAAAGRGLDRRPGPAVRVHAAIMLSTDTDVRHAVDAMKARARDVFIRGCPLETRLGAIEDAFRHVEREAAAARARAVRARSPPCRRARPRVIRAG